MPVAFDAARVYAHDKSTARICTQMAIDGFAFDSERAAAMSGYLRDLEAAQRARIEGACGRALAPTKTGGFLERDLHAVIFGDFGAPVLLRTALTGRPSLSVNALRAYAAGHNEDLRTFCESLLIWRNLRTVRSTFVDGIEVGADGRVHPTWQNFGAVSGRFSCASPNLMNLPTPRKDPTYHDPKGNRPTPFEGGIRSLLCAAPGHALVALDYKQLEWRIAAYASGDAAMIAAANSEDVHATNAATIFGALFTDLPLDSPRRKGLRTISKSGVFAVCYMAEAPTVHARLLAEGERVTLRETEAFLRKLRRGIPAYYAWQEARFYDAIRTGYVLTPILGRRRVLGHDPSATECANFPIQGGAADLMNARLQRAVAELRAHCPGTRCVAQVHDNATFEVSERYASLATRICIDVFTAPCIIDSSGDALSMTAPIDIETSERWH